MMLLPIGVSVIAVIHSTIGDLGQKGKDDFQYALLLGIAYGSTIGGMSTLVGTAPNAMMAAFVLENYGTQIDFARWMLVGLPLSALMLPLSWLALTRVVFHVDFRTTAEGREHLKNMKTDMGKISTPERRVAWVFVLLALTWIFRPLLARLPGLESLDDSGIAMAGAVALFLIPSGDAKDPLLLRWDQVEKLPWAILILFGGGLSLANAVSQTGLAAWIGDSLHLVATLPSAVLVMIVAAMIIFLTELTSNVATTATFLPVVGAIAIEAGIDPIVLLVPVTLAASCAFMLPVATPPNAIVFGSGLLTIPKMVRAGIALNIIGIVLVSLVALTLVPKFLHG
jgi:sodium-dependent dicarboxylate transporter 2/3/5